jgi:hypothetical protein
MHFVKIVPPYWAQHEGKNAPSVLPTPSYQLFVISTRLRGFHQFLPGRIHRSQPSANSVTKRAYFSFSMTLANQSATITSPTIRVLSYDPFPIRCSSELNYLLQRNDIQPHENLASYRV